MIHLMHQKKIRYPSEAFHCFFAYDFGEEDPDSAGQNSRKNTVAHEKEFGIAEEWIFFGHEERALWNERICERNLRIFYIGITTMVIQNTFIKWYLYNLWISSNVDHGNLEHTIIWNEENLKSTIDHHLFHITFPATLKMIV